MPTRQEVKFKRKTTNEIDNLEVEDGALIYNVDNGKTYMDYGTRRIQTGGNADTIIAIGEEEPTDKDIKLWIDTENSETKASEIVNEYTKSNEVGYSANYMNDKLNTLIKNVEYYEIYKDFTPKFDCYAEITMNISAWSYDGNEITVNIVPTKGNCVLIFDNPQIIRGHNTVPDAFTVSAVYRLTANETYNFALKGLNVTPVNLTGMIKLIPIY